MAIKNIPEDRESFEQYNIEYERTHFRYAEANYRIGSATRDLLLGFYLPKFLWPLGKPFINALMDDPLCEAFGFDKVPMPIQYFVKKCLKLRGKLLRHFPERRHPRLGTQVKRPTYPQGYKIEGLGTFKGPDSV